MTMNNGNDRNDLSAEVDELCIDGHSDEGGNDHIKSEMVSQSPVRGKRRKDRKSSKTRKRRRKTLLLVVIVTVPPQIRRGQMRM